MITLLSAFFSKRQNFQEAPVTTKHRWLVVRSPNLVRIRWENQNEGSPAVHTPSALDYCMQRKNVIKFVHNYSGTDERGWEAEVSSVERKLWVLRSSLVIRKQWR